MPVSVIPEYREASAVGSEGSPAHIGRRGIVLRALVLGGGRWPISLRSDGGLHGNASCQVFDGTPFVIEPEHAGVTIALSAIFVGLRSLAL